MKSCFNKNRISASEIQ